MKLTMGDLLCLTILICGCAPGASKSPASEDFLNVVQDTTPPQVVFETDEQLVADAVLRCILTSPETQSSVAFYGTPGSKKLCLRGGRARWPSDEYPAVAAYEVHFGRWLEMETGDHDRVLGLVLEALTIKPIDEWPFVVAEARVTICNAGGTKNGQVIGSCNASFKVSKTDHQGWVAEVVGLFDP